MRINADRLHASIRELARIGATPGGGVTRLALSREDRVARDLLRRWMEEAALQVRVDDFGNMTGRRAGANSGAAARKLYDVPLQPRRRADSESKRAVSGPCTTRPGYPSSAVAYGRS